MKQIAATFTRGAAAIVVIGALGVSLAGQATVLSQLGTSEQEAKENLVETLNSGYPAIGSAAKAFKAAAPAVRATIAQGLVAWARAYTGSAEFKSAYAELRAHNKPEPPTVAGSVDDELKKRRAETEQQIAEMRKAAASMAPEQRRAIEDMIKQITAQQAAMAADPQFQKMQRDGMNASRAETQKRYDDDVAKWNANYPVNPAGLIARRLHAFLDMSASVDFSARLVAANGRMRFENQQYEEKPSEWKLCYRAGREAVTAARTGATAWLAELERK